MNINPMSRWNKGAGWSMRYKKTEKKAENNTSDPLTMILYVSDVSTLVIAALCPYRT